MKMKWISETVKKITTYLKVFLQGNTGKDDIIVLVIQTGSFVLKTVFNSFLVSTVQQSMSLMDKLGE